MLPNLTMARRTALPIGQTKNLKILWTSNFIISRPLPDSGHMKKQSLRLKVNMTLTPYMYSSVQGSKNILFVNCSLFVWQNSVRLFGVYQKTSVRQFDRSVFTTKEVVWKNSFITSPGWLLGRRSAGTQIAIIRRAGLARHCFQNRRSVAGTWSILI